MKEKGQAILKKIITVFMFLLAILVVLVYKFKWLNEAVNLYSLICYEVLFGGILVLFAGFLKKKNINLLSKIITLLGFIIFLVGLTLLIYFCVHGDIVLIKKEGK